ncbi:lactonase family protein [Leeuwenhoekiella palythoae]|uniref:6-phosphogluconolactonase n=1 Tax=Leeuwenhoekiella palythoae TaxID=573501 RepID=A0A1M5TT93_9FLAO|nr:lactonase family protein [Leeuwenhoekiella palythoae]RXG28563.1 6-phosphogluconolactonase [Leeuwenhoekiella palythoae]SHH53997.1 6-phosphogluconolactonase [Leeuwenhoekiella palythoae]
MKAALLGLSLCTLLSCKNTEKKSETDMTDTAASPRTTFYLGTYTDGESQGIYKAGIEDDGTFTKPVLVATTSNPSFLALSATKHTLLAVNEDDPGMITSFEVKNDSLVQLSQTETGGAHPCFVTLNENNDVLVANYSGGNLGLLKLNEKDGSLSALLDVEQHEGQGTTDRQEGPHAHSVWFLPDGSGIVSADLGTNQLWFSKINNETQKLEPAENQKLDFPEGAGPRHLVFHPANGFIYVLNELDNTIAQVGKENGQYSVLAVTSILPEGFSEYSKAADIHISDDGRFIYASNRGHDSIAILEVDDQGALSLIANEPTKGKDPRNFQITPDQNFVIVANQNSNNLVSYTRDPETGLLTYASEIAAPKPVCILFD